MFRQTSSFLGAALAAAGVLAGAAGDTRAQQPSPVGALSGYTTGSQIDRRPIVPVTAYSSSTYVPGNYGTMAPPIFMTTINTPGIYGAYSYGVAPLLFNPEPTFYPAYNPRLDIPAITTTIAPLKPIGPGGTASTLTGVSGYAGSGPSLTAMAEPRTDTARVTVRVPADAALYFQGVKMNRSGRTREFVTPALVDGRRYTYDIRAVWNDNGKQVSQERHITVRPGEHVNVSFLNAPPASNPTLRTGPSPGVPGGRTTAEPGESLPPQHRTTR